MSLFREPRARALARLLRLALPAAVLLLAAVAWARGGGGGSFSSGNHGGSYGGGGGGGIAGDLIGLLLQLCIEEPQIGIPLVIILVIFVVARGALASDRHENGTWTTSAPLNVPSVATPRPLVRRDLESLRQLDPDFSVVLFEDFLYALYAEAHYAAGEGKIDRLSPYLSPGALETVGRAVQGTVRSVIVGGMRITSVEGARDADVSEVRVAVEFEANYAVVSPDGRENAYYVRESWRLKRAKSARSRPPERTRVFTCPNCGAPLDAVIAGQCSYCKKNVATGEHDWLVQAIVEEERQSRGPILTGESREAGLTERTLIDPDARERLDALLARDPSFNWAGFVGRLRLIFAEFQGGWSERDLARIRPFLSDKLFEEQRYWIETYLAQHLRNAVENPHLDRAQLARVTSDKYFDAITVRIYAGAVDYTVDDAGRVVAGERGLDRPFSEYWTLIRSSGVRGPAQAEKKCPHCGAPLKINMSGVCEYCRATVTSGQFDWVLSRIEQPSVYTG